MTLQNTWRFLAWVALPTVALAASSVACSSSDTTNGSTPAAAGSAGTSAGGESGAAGSNSTAGAGGDTGAGGFPTGAGGNADTTGGFGGAGEVGGQSSGTGGSSGSNTGAGGDTGNAGAAGSDATGGSSGGGGANADKTFALSFKGSGFTPHVGKFFEAALVDQATGVVVKKGTRDPLVASTFDFEWTNVLEKNHKYYLDYFSDLNDSDKMCQFKSAQGQQIDHVWRVEIPKVTAKVEVLVAHNTNWVDVCSTFNK